MLKNCAPFIKCLTHINDEHFDGANSLDIIMPMYNLIEYSIIIQTFQEVYGSLKRDESPMTNALNPDNVSKANSTSFKYRSSFF